MSLSKDTTILGIESNYYLKVQFKFPRIHIWKQYNKTQPLSREHISFIFCVMNDGRDFQDYSGLLKREHIVFTNFNICTLSSVYGIVEEFLRKKFNQARVRQSK